MGLGIRGKGSTASSVEKDLNLEPFGLACSLGLRALGFRLKSSYSFGAWKSKHILKPEGPASMVLDLNKGPKKVAEGLLNQRGPILLTRRMQRTVPKKSIPCHDPKSSTSPYLFLQEKRSFTCCNHQEKLFTPQIRMHLLLFEFTWFGRMRSAV